VSLGCGAPGLVGNAERPARLSDNQVFRRSIFRGSVNDLNCSDVWNDWNGWNILNSLCDSNPDNRVIKTSRLNKKKRGKLIDNQVSNR
jgi:hypothetical protein